MFYSKYFALYIKSFNQSGIYFCTFMAIVWERSNFAFFHRVRQSLMIYF